jgi:hypothetical protein
MKKTCSIEAKTDGVNAVCQTAGFKVARANKKALRVCLSPVSMRHARRRRPLSVLAGTEDDGGLADGWMEGGDEMRCVDDSPRSAPPEASPSWRSSCARARPLAGSVHTCPKLATCRAPDACCVSSKAPAAERTRHQVVTCSCGRLALIMIIKESLLMCSSCTIEQVERKRTGFCSPATANGTVSHGGGATGHTAVIVRGDGTDRPEPRRRGRPAPRGAARRRLFTN